MKIQAIYVVPWWVVVIKIVGWLVGAATIALGLALEIVGFPRDYIVLTTLGIMFGLIVMGCTLFVVHQVKMERRDREERTRNLAAYQARVAAKCQAMRDAV